MPTDHDDTRAPYLTEHADAELDALDRAREARWNLTERGREALEMPMPKPEPDPLAAWRQCFPGHACSCFACAPLSALGTPLYFPVCPTCGNKRCPKGTDHALECTGSNEPGQPGSRFA